MDNPERKVEIKKLYAPALIEFDYAIIYLLEYRKEYDIVEGFISDLIKTQGYKEVKIKEVLKNKKDSTKVWSVAHLLVEDQDHRQYIVEIDRIINEAALNRPQRIIDDCKLRAGDQTPLKVFHIILTEAPIGDSPLYHKKAAARKESATIDTLPEYFIISMTGFDGRLEREIDDWLYAMKFSKIPDTCRSSHMKKVDEKLNYLKMPFEAHRDYLNYSKAVCDNRISVETIEDMNEYAKAEAAEKVAVNMLEANMDVGLIVEITKLSLEHIESLKSSLSKAK